MYGCMSPTVLSSSHFESNVMFRGKFSCSQSGLQQHCAQQSPGPTELPGANHHRQEEESSLNWSWGQNLKHLCFRGRATWENGNQTWKWDTSKYWMLMVYHLLINGDFWIPSHVLALQIFPSCNSLEMLLYTSGSTNQKLVGAFKHSGKYESVAWDEMNFPIENRHVPNHQKEFRTQITSKSQELPVSCYQTGEWQWSASSLRFWNVAPAGPHVGPIARPFVGKMHHTQKLKM